MVKISITKVVRMIGGSPDSWEKAVQTVVEKAVKDFGRVSRVYVENFSCRVDGERIVEYRATVRLIVPA